MLILIFHRVRARTDALFPDDPDVSLFEAQMRWVASWFNVLPLTQAISRLHDGTLPARAAAITFDDGYADNCTLALPILRKLGLNATFFIATGFLDGGRMWNDTVIESVRGAIKDDLDATSLGLGRMKVDTPEAKRQTIHALLPRLKYLEPREREARSLALAAQSGATLPTDLMLTSEMLRELTAAGMTIGAHTVTHPILATLDEETARKEIGESREQLESITKTRILLFAYPNGKPGRDYGAQHVALVRQAGFLAAVSTGAGAASVRSDLFQLPRFTPWDRSSRRYAMRLAGNFLRHPAVAALHPVD